MIEKITLSHIDLDGNLYKFGKLKKIPNFYHQDDSINDQNSILNSHLI